ncbi:MAG: NUDIX domain-containing protein [Treponema sp.]|jgi:8-oxo-dGTP diphosphatase|nr:NUDIX domain-containing protein [Treponema sp.]
MMFRTSVAGIALEEQKVFIARRLPGGAMGGRWEFPGGKVREGESETAALIREFEEEFALPVEPLFALGEASFVHKDTRFTLRAYRIKFLSAEYVLSVHSEVRWAFPAELEGLDFVDSDRLLFPVLQNTPGPITAGP